ncbi:hypothetical protein G9A89_003030 [Geosiphon pyriformis]|nr:hypothetical protein G9A89_003030 [Geosiphon pyriformis]
MQPVEPLSKINLMDCSSTLASVYIAVIGLASRAALLNNGVAAVSSNLNGNIVTNDSSSVMVAGDLNSSGNLGSGVDWYPNSTGIIQMVVVKNWGSVDGLLSLISSSVKSFLVFGFRWVVSFGVVFGFVGVDRLFVAAVVDKSLVAVVDRLELDILETNRLMTVSLVLMEVSQVVVVAVEAVVVVLGVEVIVEVALEDSGFQLPGFQCSGFEIPKSGGGGSDRSPDRVDDHELNPSKYSLYGPSNSVFLCLLWNGNCPNVDVAVDVNVSVDDMLMVLPGV